MSLWNHQIHMVIAEYTWQECFSSNKDKINILIEELQIEIKKQEKLKFIREKIHRLKEEIYIKAKNDYGAQTSNQLRIPLLIYSGKILQDYQGGLGVFINKEEMRFVANGDAKHDILNTFTSKCWLWI